MTYIGGARDKEIGDMSNDEILGIVRGDIKKVMLKEGANEEEAVELLGMKVWPRAIPQYGRGHEELLAKITEVRHFFGKNSEARAKQSEHFFSPL